MNKLQISIALVIIALVFVGYGMFSIGSIKVEDSFKDRLAYRDSLIRKNKDSIALMTVIQDSFKVQYNILTYQKEHTPLFLLLFYFFYI